MSENDTGDEADAPQERGAGPSSPQNFVALGKGATPPPVRPGTVTLYYDGTYLLAKFADGSTRPVDLGSAQSYTAANIAAVAHAVNTTGKVAGLIVFDTTNVRLMRSTGALAASPWRTLDGVTTVTPA
jgi:hypothetical protein